MNRKYIRKLVLQEFRSRLIEEAKVKKQKSFPNIDAAQQAKEVLENNAALLAEGVPPIGPAGNGTMLSKSAAVSLAKKLNEAFSGTELASGQLFGMGTNEDLIIETLKKIPTVADLSFVSHVYGEKYKGSFGTVSLAADLQGEYGKFTGPEFYDVRLEIEEIYNRGLFALGGEVYTLKKMRQVEARARKTQQDFLQNVVTGDMDAYGQLAVDSVQNAAVAAGAGLGIAAGAAAGYGAVIGLASGVSVAGSVGAASATLGLGALAASGASLGLGGAAAIGIGIGPVGWVGLAVGAIGVGLLVAWDNEEFSAAELKMLSPDFYLGLDTMFKALSKNFQAAADTINLDEYADPDSAELDSAELDSAELEPGEDTTELEADGLLPDGRDSNEERYKLEWGLDRSYIENIVNTMNTYFAIRPGVNLEMSESYADAATVWNPKIQKVWLNFAAHALTHCSIYKDNRALAGNVASWTVLSGKLSKQFPGYTPNPRGCLAFCLDSYYDEVKYGGSASPAPSAGGPPVPLADDDDTPNPTPEKLAQESGGITIRSVAGSAGNVPLSDAFDSKTEADLIKAIDEQFNTGARRSTVRAAALEFVIKLNRKHDKIIRVKRKMPIGSTDGRDFKLGLPGMVKDALQYKMSLFSNNPKAKEYVGDRNTIGITVTIPAGYKIPKP